MFERCPDCGQLCMVKHSGKPQQWILVSMRGSVETYHDLAECIWAVKNKTLEGLVWAIFLDNPKSLRVFEEWKKLWVTRNEMVPEGAWECP